MDMQKKMSKRIYCGFTVVVLAGLSLGVIGLEAVYGKKVGPDKNKNLYENKQPIAKVPSTYGFGAAIAAADMNNDGLVDLVSAESNGDIFVYTNDGKQFVKGKKPILKVQSFYGFGPSISAADMDGDGLTDLLSADSEGKVYVHKNLGNNTFK